MKKIKFNKKVLIVFLGLVIALYVGRSLSFKGTQSASFNPCDNVVDNPNGYKCIDITDENGNAPAHEIIESQKSRGIRGIKGYNGKVFLAQGDYADNDEAVVMLYYDTKTGKMDSSGTVNEQAMFNFREIYGKLYTTSADSLQSYDGPAGYYIYNEQNDVWDPYFLQMKNGFISMILLNMIISYLWLVL